MENYPVVVVGGGPAGLAAAMAARSAGVRVLLLERGSFSGAKNVSGGILFTRPFEQLVPDIWQTDAPLERPVARRSYSFLSQESSADFSFRCDSFARPPYNNAFTVLRSPFDRWLAQRAEDQGVDILNGVVVDGLLRDDRGRVIGVQTRSDDTAKAGDGDVLADVVILAEGVNALIGEKEGFRPKMLAADMAVGVKEIIALPRGVIQDRFLLEGDEGEGREYYGAAAAGMFGSGFVYTNRESISLGVAVSAGQLASSGMAPNDLLERFKAHPSVRPLWRSGEVIEYSAHMIPEGGHNRVSRLFADGILIVGDAAGLVNVSPYHEGSNLAVASGVAAGEVAAEALASGDTSAAYLARYKERLEESFVIKDMKKFAGLPGFFKDNPQVLSHWPEVFLGMMKETFQGSGEPKQELEDRALATFNREIGIVSLLRVMFQGLQAMNALPVATLTPLIGVAVEQARRFLNTETVDKVTEYLRRNW